MNKKRIKKTNEYLDDNEDYLITDKNFKFKDIPKNDIEILLENIKDIFLIFIIQKKISVINVLISLSSHIPD